ncbi:tRNA (N6-isopentenyl adenosine(37)-C2)-methylthiotransferase MiaB [Patescibacteria group bacterium]|nr:tRNA (N6-isopentenyl adenosine(37)-C2)-methylthiotransferase MiaB [Patescibacteria group bacterium]
MEKYYIITFGCQMNRSDSERIATILEDIGYEKASNANGADLIVVNMCSVRQSAVDRVYGLYSKFKKLKSGNKNLKTILTGCVLKEDKRKFAKLFDLILDIKDLSKWSQKLNVPCSNIYRYKEQNNDYLKIKPKYQTLFSAYVPIMTGCNNFCTFCVVPYLRGQEISRSAEEILFEVKNLISQNYKEIWLLGQNVNSYKDGKINFPKLLKTINEIKGDFWIRFTSSHPKDFSDELIDAMAKCEKVTEYLNLPVQSGDNEVLKRMNRPYTIEHYKNLVKKIREKIPEISLSTDVIVGFPGETREQFENTVKLFKKIKYNMAYIAKYSKRPQAKAFLLEDDVSYQEKERRHKILTEILKKTALEKNKKYIEKEIEVLINSSKDNICFGKTKTYKTVKLQTTNYKLQTNLVGQFVKIKIIDALPWGLKGSIEIKKEALALKLKLFET